MNENTVSGGDIMSINETVQENLDTSTLETLVEQNTEVITELHTAVNGIYAVQLFSLGLTVSVAVCVLLYKFIKIFY